MRFPTLPLNRFTILTHFQTRSGQEIVATEPPPASRKPFFNKLRASVTPFSEACRVSE